jgi:hypothetical protein
MNGFEDVVADVPRDRWERPLVTPSTGGSPIPYTRASTLAGTLDDTYNLTEWKKRQVAVGLSIRPSLQLRVVSLGPEPDRAVQEQAYKKWKAEMNKVCDQAMEAADSSAKATIGTSLHALTDRIDRGQDLGVVPEQYKPHLKAYEEATACLTVIHLERFVVCDELQTAGTFDRLVAVDGHPKLVIADTKSGNVEYAGKIAIQESVYAHGSLYDHLTNTRTPLGDVDLERGLIIALSAATGTCELIWVDIQAGWAGAKEARWVREFRSRQKKLARPFKTVTAAVPPENDRDLTVEAQAALEAGIRGAPTVDDLVRLWTVAGNQWQPHHTQLAAARKAELQQRHLTIVS